MAQVAVMVAISLIQANEAKKAGRARNAQAKVAAKQEEVAAIGREADRKGRLATAMASQTAAAGASGIAAFEGSPLTILNEDIRT